MQTIDVGRKFVRIVDQRVDGINEVVRHCMNEHRDYASWCGECRWRRFQGVLEGAAIVGIMIFLALLRVFLHPQP